MWWFLHIHEAPTFVVLAHFGARSDGNLRRTSRPNRPTMGMLQ
jgi:hypothetical protein